MRKDRQGVGSELFFEIDFQTKYEIFSSLRLHIFEQTMHVINRLGEDGGVAKTWIFSHSKSL